MISLLGYSQCENCGTNYPTGTFSTTSAAWNPIGANGNVASADYSYYSLNSNYIYQWKSCDNTGYDTQLTLYPSGTCGNGGTLWHPGPYSLAYNDDYCGLQSCMAYTPGTTSVRMLFNRYNCQGLGYLHTINLYDSYGDGWHGDNYINVIVDGTTILSNLTLGSGSGPASYTFRAGTGSAIQVTFTSGSWSTECYFSVTDGLNNTLVSDYYPSTSGTWNGTGANGAKVKWRAIPRTPTISGGGVTICSGQSVNLTASNIGNNDSFVDVRWGTSSGGTQVNADATTVNVSPTSTTTYYLRYDVLSNTSLDAFPGTQSSYVASTTITVRQPPTAPTGVLGTATICEGNNVTLTATGGSVGSGATYQWYAGGCGSGSVLGTGVSINVSPTTTTTYYVRRVGNSPCNSTVTSCASGTVIVNAVSVVPSSIGVSVNP